LKITQICNLDILSERTNRKTYAVRSFVKLLHISGLEYSSWACQSNSVCWMIQMMMLIIMHLFLLLFTCLS